MLKNKYDLQSVAYMVIITGLLVLQWQMDRFQPALWTISLFMAVPVAVMAHNHNHLPMWKSTLLNQLTDYWLTLFYGYPAFGWIPTHNANHHVYNNRVPDYTITYRLSEKNNLLTLLSYPTVSGGIQQRANYQYILGLWKSNRGKFFYSMSQLLLLFIFIGGALALDWRKAVWFVILPQQFSLFAVLIFNYIQHVHADEESKWNHSRNFEGRLINAFLFNNGFHTVHHMYPKRHWSDNSAAHREIAHLIDPVLNEKSFWWYMIRVYILGPFIPSLKTQSMRVKRLNAIKQGGLNSIPIKMDENETSNLSLAT